MIAVSGFPLRVPTLVTTVGHIAASYHSERPAEEEWPEKPDYVPSAPLSREDRQRIFRYLGDIKVNPGNSGGPVYRVRDGAIIGVARAYIPSAAPTVPDPEIVENSGISIIVPIGTDKRTDVPTIIGGAKNLVPELRGTERMASYEALNFRAVFLTLPVPGSYSL